MKRASGFSLIETLAALAILLAFLTAVVPAMYRAQHGNAQSAFIAASNIIVNKMAPEFANQRGPAYNRYVATTGGYANINAPGPVPTCDQHLGGQPPTAWNMGDLSSLNIFTEVTSGDQKGFNDPALYTAHVRGYTEDLGSMMGVRQMFEISVFYPNPTDASGRRNCYSMNVAANGRFGAAP